MSNKEENPISPKGCLVILGLLLVIAVASEIAAGILEGVGRAVGAIPWYNRVANG